jgi:hypothetical protein
VAVQVRRVTGCEALVERLAGGPHHLEVGLVAAHGPYARKPPGPSDGDVHLVDAEDVELPEALRPVVDGDVVGAGLAPAVPRVRHPLALQQVGEVGDARQSASLDRPA